jgi:endonuclease/exonuclease/phosphatase family metal-dependent hydrolase
MLLVLMLAGGGGGVVPSGAAAGADGPAAPLNQNASLRVMSLNVRYGTADDGAHAWSHRAPVVQAVVREFGPDLLGTQECLAFQRDQLLAGLDGFAVVAAGRDDGGEQGEMCASFYRADRFVLRGSGTFWLGESPGVPGSRGWDAALPRVATWLRLFDRRGGGEVLWLNTHLDHAGERARRESAAQIHRWLREHRRGATLVVTGDFNAPAAGRGATVHRLLRYGADAGVRPTPADAAATAPLLVDTWAARHGEDPRAGTFHGFGDRIRPGRIDWVLVSADASVLAADLDTRRHGGLWPSDHLPVTAVVAGP